MKRLLKGRMFLCGLFIFLKEKVIQTDNWLIFI